MEPSIRWCGLCNFISLLGFVFSADTFIVDLCACSFPVSELSGRGRILDVTCTVCAEVEGIVPGVGSVEGSVIR